MNKLTLFTFLIILSVILSCNNSRYVKNKFSIESIHIVSINKDSITVGFDLKFYSDSATSNYTYHSLERGLDGTIDKIQKISFCKENVSGEIDSNNIHSSEFKNWKDFMFHFNRGDRNTTGERLTLDITIPIDTQMYACLKDTKFIQIKRFKKSPKKNLIHLHN